MKIPLDNLPLDQRPISFEIRPEMADRGRHLISWFQSEVEAGRRFRDGEKVQIGWSWLQFRETGSGLEGFEPDFQSMPIEWIPGVSSTVRFLLLQRNTCDLCNCEPEFAEIRQSGVISPEFVKSQEFTMSRDAPVNRDSGWVFYETGYSGTEGQLVSLYQLAFKSLQSFPFWLCRLRASSKSTLAGAKSLLGELHDPRKSPHFFTL